MAVAIPHQQRFRPQRAIVLTGSGLVIGLTITGCALRVPSAWWPLGPLMYATAIGGLTVAPAVRHHGLVAIGVGVVGGSLGGYSLSLMVISELLWVSPPWWVDQTVPWLMLAFVVTAVLLIGVGIGALVSREPSGRKAFGWSYVVLAATAICLFQAAWLVSVVWHRGW